MDVFPSKWHPTSILMSCFFGWNKNQLIPISSFLLLLKKQQYKTRSSWSWIVIQQVFENVRIRGDIVMASQITPWKFCHFPCEPRFGAFGSKLLPPKMWSISKSSLCFLVFAYFQIIGVLLTFGRSFKNLHPFWKMTKVPSTDSQWEKRCLWVNVHWATGHARGVSREGPGHKQRSVVLFF